MSQRYWTGKTINSLQENQIFVFGSNPEGRHGMGAAKAAMQFGAKYGKGRGLSGKTYALVTKNLKAGYTEPCTGITYKTAGAKSVSAGQIVNNILELYEVARNKPNMDFLVTYQNGSKNLNGYTPKAMLSMLQGTDGIPNNILLHESFKPKAKVLKVLIAGGRDYINYLKLEATLVSVLRKKVDEGYRIVIVSGEAKGADALGEKFAKNYGYKVEPYPAKWKELDVEGAVIRSNQYGKYNAVAGHMRNEDMAKACDVAVMFWDGFSTGTCDMIERIKSYGKPIRIIKY